MSAREELIEVLSLARKALSHPDNDFSWSSWRDADEAVTEIDAFVGALERNESFDRLELEVLFAATGPICETSISSGWSDAYLRLSERFDTALDRFAVSTA